MGSWAGTCAVSHLAIGPGERVLYIYCTQKYVENTHSLMDAVKTQEENDKDLRENREFHESVITKVYGNRPLVVHGFGEYDDYGGIEDVEIPEDCEESLIMVREDVANKMSEFAKTLMPRELSSTRAFLAESYLYRFVILCWLTRINLFGHTLLGRQYPDSSEMRERMVVHRIIGQEVRTVSKNIRDSEKEYKEWCKSISKTGKE